MNTNPEDEWLGVIVHRGRFFSFRGILADFILDYRAYDPEFSRRADAVSFRGGILTVTPENAAEFMQAVNARCLTPEEAVKLAQSSSDTSRLLALIDFDSRGYVHSYFDLPMEEYVPRGWRGTLGDPQKELKARIVK